MPLRSAFPWKRAARRAVQPAAGLFSEAAAAILRIKLAAGPALDDHQPLSSFPPSCSQLTATDALRLPTVALIVAFVSVFCLSAGHCTRLLADTVTGTLALDADDVHVAVVVRFCVAPSLGAAYDALVAATAAAHSADLVTCDRRAASVYECCGVRATFLA